MQTILATQLLASLALTCCLLADRSAATSISTPRPPNDSDYEEADPLETDLCIVNPAEVRAFKVNHSWTDGTCGRVCRCVFRSEPHDELLDARVEQTHNMRPDSEQTEIRCTRCNQPNIITDTPSTTSTSAAPVSSTPSTTVATVPTTPAATESTTIGAGHTLKSDALLQSGRSNHQVPPCSRAPDDQGDEFMPLPWIQIQVNGPLQKYAWVLLGCLTVMTFLFIVMTFLYLRGSTRVITPINSQSAYDSSCFTKLVSYNKPHMLIVDERRQNFNNDSILAKQKNLEADKESPLHQQSHIYKSPIPHQPNDEVYHRNGSQHLI